MKIVAILVVVLALVAAIVTAAGGTRTDRPTRQDSTTAGKESVQLG